MKITEIALLSMAAVIIYTNKDLIGMKVRRAKLWLEFRMPSWASKVYNSQEILVNKFNVLQNDLGATYEQTTKEMNHIKGSNQEILHKIADIHNALASGSQQETAALYLQSLATISKGIETVIERQEKVEKLLVDVLKSLTA